MKDVVDQQSRRSSYSIAVVIFIDALFNVHRPMRRKLLKVLRPNRVFVRIVVAANDNTHKHGEKHEIDHKDRYHKEWDGGR